MKRKLYQLAPRSMHFNPKRLVWSAQRKSAPWPCRCRHASCQKRRTLPKHPDSYAIPPRCRGCGRRGTMRVDWFRIAAELGVRPCRCHGYLFPHHKGRGYCDHNPSVTAEQLQERYEQGKWR